MNNVDYCVYSIELGMNLMAGPDPRCPSEVH